MMRIFADSTLLTLEEGVSKASELWDGFWPSALRFLIDVVIALLVWFVGKALVKLILKLTKRIFERTQLDFGVQSFLSSIIKCILYVVLIITIASILGLPTTSLIAILGSVGLAIGLALQGSLSNFAGGVLILILKPFSVGDYISTAGGDGTVSSIDIFYTKLTTIDNRVIVMPNGTLSNGNVINYTKNPERRIDLVVTVGYQDDIRHVKRVLEQIAEEQKEYLLPGKPVDIGMANFGDNAIELNYRLWVKTQDYWPVRAEILERMKYLFDENGISIPYPHMDVTILK